MLVRVCVSKHEFKFWTNLQGTESRVETFHAETCIMSQQSQITVTLFPQLVSLLRTILHLGQSLAGSVANKADTIILYQHLTTSMACRNSLYLIHHVSVVTAIS